MKLIGTKLIKAEKNNEYAYFEEQYCKNPHKCPILEQGKCIHRQIFGICIYGQIKSIKSSSTKRGKAYSTFVREKQKQIDDNKFPKMPKGEYNNCIAKIGDYYYLPYSFMNTKCTKYGYNKIPFLKHSSFMITGSCFIEAKNFTPETIKKIYNHIPYALIVREEIKNYQEKELPKFLFHLKYLFPDLFEKTKKLLPEIEDKILKIDTTKEIEATLSDIPKGLIEGYVVGKNLNVKSWNGKNIVVEGTGKDFSFFLCGFKSEGLYTMSFEPILKETKVIIKDTELKIKVCINNPLLI